eukprot:CAMPEP_0170524604 /NCGR_PEP_ID=MMETSP0209-20121228/10085_1 /TAXON_ID=665100 ORGANISM="Litonotus pictus, Strain P1" /NCGR_SAMPLE_ID=MMETSP0209 /ASSEMBLY_ACC=CAM_ASM_000301 /LENGTH=1140 /DNA_ID=CAMNT_0010813413 /DNA_START=862 /DNA_END=4284 /DNA_ORIENTATION=-
MKLDQDELKMYMQDIITNIDFHIGSISSKSSNIFKSISIFRYYLEIIHSRYIYSDHLNKEQNTSPVDINFDTGKDNVEFKKEKLTKSELILNNYYENCLSLHLIQKDCLKDPKNEKYVIGTRNVLVQSIYEFFVQSSKVIKLPQTAEVKTLKKGLDLLKKHIVSVANAKKMAKHMGLGFLSKEQSKEEDNEEVLDSQSVEVDITKNEILKGSSQLRIFNKIFKIDVDPIQNYFVTEKGEWISTLIKICVHNLKEIMKKNIFGYDLDMKSKQILVSSFVDQLEFLRLFCENHNKMFQYIIIKYDKQFLGDLLGFSIKILMSLNANYQNYKYLNCQSRNQQKTLEVINLSLEPRTKNILKLHKVHVLNTSKLKENYENADRLFEIIFEFLIEIVQGATPSTFDYLFNAQEEGGNWGNFQEFFYESSRFKEKINHFCNDEYFNGLVTDIKTKETVEAKNNENSNTDVEGEFYSNMTTIKFFTKFVKFSTQCLEEANNSRMYKYKILEKFNEIEFLKLLRELYKKVIKVNLYKGTNLELGYGDEVVKNLAIEEEGDSDDENDEEKESKSVDSPKPFEEECLSEEIKKLFSSDALLDDVSALHKLESCYFFKLFMNLSLFTKYSINLKRLKGDLDLEEKINVINKRENELENYYFEQTRKFHEQIIVRIEVNYKDSAITPEVFLSYKHLMDQHMNNQENEISIFNNDEILRKSKSSFIKEIYFFKSPDCFYLKPEDIENIIPNTTLNVYKQRLVDFLDQVDGLKKNINIRKNIQKNTTDGFKVLYSIEFKSLINYSVIISAIINVLLVLYSTISSISIGGVTSSRHQMWANPMANWIFFLAVFQIMYLITGLATYAYVNSKICMLEDQHENQYSTYDEQFKENKLAYCLKIFGRLIIKLHDEVEVLLLLWNLIFGFLAFAYPIFYSIQLLSVIFIVQVMKDVLSSFLKNNRYKQFIAMGVMIGIILFIYAFISFFFFKASFDDDDLGENTCETPLVCFFTLLNQALRSGEGPGFGIKDIKEPGYFGEFLLTWTFYFILILIMISIINGIIVDAFQELRKNQNTEEEIRENNCFICDLDSTTLEVNGEKFDNHINDTHSMGKYLNYLIHVLTTPELDLNAVESYVFNKLKISDTSFFPNKNYFKLK